MYNNSFYKTFCPLFQFGIAEEATVHIFKHGTLNFGTLVANDTQVFITILFMNIFSENVSVDMVQVKSLGAISVIGKNTSNAFPVWSRDGSL